MSYRLLYLVIGLSFCGVSTYAQEKEITEEEVFEAFDDAFKKLGEGVHLTVDKSLYSSTLGGVYLSDNPRATLMSKVKLGKLSSVEKSLAKESKKGGIVVTKTGYVKKDSRNMFLQLGYRLDADGVKMNIDKYVYQADDETLVYIIGSYIAEAKTYKEATEKAAFSAQYIKKSK